MSKTGGRATPAGGRCARKRVHRPGSGRVPVHEGAARYRPWQMEAHALTYSGTSASLKQVITRAQ